jgi:hypothetical protein
LFNLGLLTLKTLPTGGDIRLPAGKLAGIIPNFGEKSIENSGQRLADSGQGKKIKNKRAKIKDVEAALRSFF